MATLSHNPGRGARVRQELLKPFTVSAPGSVMITGEHAVVAGYRAIVCAIDQRIRMRVTPLDEPEVQITSSIFILERLFNFFPGHSGFRILVQMGESLFDCGKNS